MNAPSNFNPEAFLDAVMENPLERRIPLPVGDYTAIITKPSIRTWAKRSDPSVTGLALDLELQLEIPADVQAECQLDKPNMVLRDSIMLDLTAGGMLDDAPGKNKRMRQYREAVGMNNKGDKFSPRKLEGQAVLVRVTHEMWEGQPIERVSAVVAL